MTTPTGKLAWGQAASYDAVDDRQVIAAVTRNRTGLVWPVVARPGAGLQFIVEGGWLGVASCGDRTSAVVGSRLDVVVTAIPGQPTGTRQDVIWCDTEPDEGEWSLRVIPRSESAGRPGVVLGYINVPANATLASQMEFDSAGARLERRLMLWASSQDNRTTSGTTWDTADTLVWATTLIEPGQWYRVRYTANSPMATSGDLQGRIGVGWRAAGAPEASTTLRRASVITWARLNGGTHAEVEYYFRHGVNEPAVERTWVGRMWKAGVGNILVASVTNQGEPHILTIEDVGS